MTMNLAKLTTVLSLGILSLLWVSCSHYDDVMKNGKESSTDNESHNAGENCMRCHNDGQHEASEYWWYVGGTVYHDDEPDEKAGSIELWTEAGRKGTLLHKLQVDHSGNFYTQKIINFKGGFYPVFVSDDGKKVNGMTTKINTGACNSCHGVTEAKIETH